MKHYVTKEMIMKMDKCSWIVHAVSDCGTGPKVFKDFRCDYHTHGLNEYGSKELQFTLMVNPGLAGYLINTIGNLILRGKKINGGDVIFGLFDEDTLPVAVVDTKDSYGEDILRICIPDDNGKVYPEKAEGIYSEQVKSPYLDGRGE